MRNFLEKVDYIRLYRPKNHLKWYTISPEEFQERVSIIQGFWGLPNLPGKPGDYKYSKNIWVDAMEGYLKDHEDSWYKQPNNVVGVLVNPITGKPATIDDEKKRIMYYIRGTEPRGDEPVFDEIMEITDN